LISRIVIRLLSWERTAKGLWDREWLHQKMI
jgi:hypothetical protein